MMGIDTHTTQYRPSGKFYLLLCILGSATLLYILFRVLGGTALYAQQQEAKGRPLIGEKSQIDPQAIFSDDFETDRGWQVNPSGTDTATSGTWERGIPEPTNNNGPKQIAARGRSDLVTGRLAGSNAGAYDVDGELTSIRSPELRFDGRSRGIGISFNYYLAHSSNASAEDLLRIKLVIPNQPAVLLFEQKGAASNRDALWQQANLSQALSGATSFSLLVEATDKGSASLVEAALDDLKIWYLPPTK